MSLGNSWGQKVQSAADCFSCSIRKWNLFSWYSSSLLPVRQAEANTKKFLQMPSDPGLTLFHIHAPPLLFELIPLYSMCRLPSSLVRRVSSLPTLRDHVIQPEQYGADSCSRCASILLLCPMPTPPCCVCQKHNVSAPRDTGGVEGGTQQGALTKCGRDNHGGYGLPHPAGFSFYILILRFILPPPPTLLLLLFMFIFYLPLYRFRSRPAMHSWHPPFQQMLLLTFTLFSCPPPIGDIVIFRYSWWLCSLVCVCVCVWVQDVDLISQSFPCQLNSRHLLQERPLTGE